MVFAADFFAAVVFLGVLAAAFFVVPDFALLFDFLAAELVFATFFSLVEAAFEFAAVFFDAVDFAAGFFTALVFFSGSFFVFSAKLILLNGSSRS